MGRLRTVVKGNQTTDGNTRMGIQKWQYRRANRPSHILEVDINPERGLSPNFARNVGIWWPGFVTDART
jgi:hypothetical protein